MKQRATPLFRAEQARFVLRFTCEHCTYFDLPRERCSHGYPNAEHREARHGAREDSLSFCKDFELM